MSIRDTEKYFMIISNPMSTVGSSAEDTGDRHVGDSHNDGKRLFNQAITKDMVKKFGSEDVVRQEIINNIQRVSSAFSKGGNLD